MRYIDAEALLDKMQYRLPIDNKNGEVIAGCVDITRRLIEAAPTADVVEVVRCKDCKLRETSSCPMYLEEYSKWDDDGYTEVDLIVTDLTEDEGFCHCGTKMDKER